MPDELPVLDAAVTGPLTAIGPGVLSQIGGTWLQDVPVRLKALRDAVATQDPDAARRAAHALKGGSAGIGARRVQAAAQELEVRAATGELPSEVEIARLERLVAEVAPLLHG